MDNKQKIRQFVLTHMIMYDNSKKQELNRLIEASSCALFFLYADEGDYAKWLDDLKTGLSNKAYNRVCKRFQELKSLWEMENSN